MRELKIINKIAVYSDKSPIPKGEIKLRVLNIPSITSDYRLIVYQDNQELFRSNISVSDDVVTIPNDLIKSGLLNIVICEYSHGIETKRISAEPLVITDINPDAFATPEFSKLRKDLDTASKEISVLNENLKTEFNKRLELELKIEKMGKSITALINFAFDDYKNNIYLNGSDNIDEFRNKYKL